MEDFVNYFQQKHSIEQLLDIEQYRMLERLVVEKVGSNSSIFFAGNGGSAHNASHAITDLSKFLWTEKKLRLRTQCLNSEVGLLTAYANDFEYSEIFSEQLRSFARSDDLAIFFSGSGQSKNIIQALHAATELNVTSFCLLGYDGGAALKICDHHLLVPSFNMQFVEDIHMSIIHILMRNLVKNV